MKEKFNLIQALELMRKGKKVRLCEMPKGNYLYKQDDKIMCYSAECKVSVETYLNYCRLFREDIAEIYEEPKPILDAEEKAYLEAVLRPFKDRVKCIKKIESPFEPLERIRVLSKDDLSAMSFPSFKQGTMYKGMKLDKEYTLKELGLFDRKIY